MTGKMTTTKNGIVNKFRQKKAYKRNYDEYGDFRVFSNVV